MENQEQPPVVIDKEERRKRLSAVLDKRIELKQKDSRISPLTEDEKLIIRKFFKEIVCPISISELFKNKKVNVMLVSFIKKEWRTRKAQLKQSATQYLDQDNLAEIGLKIKLDFELFAEDHGNCKDFFATFNQRKCLKDLGISEGSSDFVWGIWDPILETLKEKAPAVERH